MKHKKKNRGDWSFLETFQLDREKGYRMGALKATREILIRVLKGEGKEQNYKVGKELLRKIQYETDGGYLEKLIFVAFDKNLGVEYVEKNYEKIFRTEEEVMSEKYTIYSDCSD